MFILLDTSSLSVRLHLKVLCFWIRTYITRGGDRQIWHVRLSGSHKKTLKTKDESFLLLQCWHVSKTIYVHQNPAGAGWRWRRPAELTWPLKYIYMKRTSCFQTANRSRVFSVTNEKVKCFLLLSGELFHLRWCRRTLRGGGAVFHILTVRGGPGLEGEASPRKQERSVLKEEQSKRNRCLCKLW